jgi:chemotaxis protein MotB
VRRAPAGQHRGGAWKVAYADFVTALMALFIVLWLANSPKHIKDLVSGYFRDPRGFTHRLGAGPSNAGESVVSDPISPEDLKKKLESMLRQMPNFESIRRNVEVSVTGEGVRVELLETENGMFFLSGSPQPSGTGEGLLKVLAHEVKGLPNALVVEGHTDARPFRAAGPDGYSNWELSTDRAHAARRLMIAAGLPPGQVVQVRGYADHRLLVGAEPDNPRNRRISVVVKFQAGD